MLACRVSKRVILSERVQNDKKLIKKIKSLFINDGDCEDMLCCNCSKYSNDDNEPCLLSDYWQRKPKVLVLRKIESFSCCCVFSDYDAKIQEKK